MRIEHDQSVQHKSVDFVKNFDERNLRLKRKGEEVSKSSATFQLLGLVVSKLGVERAWMPQAKNNPMKKSPAAYLRFSGVSFQYFHTWV
jgi:hypothetical protein